MARRRTHQSAPRTKTVTIRLTPDEYLRRSVDARRAGLSVSGICERLVCDGKVETGAADTHKPMDPSVFAELRRIGNNANQIAHALNSNLPPDVQFAWRTVRDLLQLLARQEFQLQREASERPRATGVQENIAKIEQQLQGLRTRTPSDGPPPPPARHVFQGSVQIHPPRRRQEHE